jgi:hypothetical protein
MRRVRIAEIHGYQLQPNAGPEPLLRVGIGIEPLLERCVVEFTTNPSQCHFREDHDVSLSPDAARNCRSADTCDFGVARASGFRNTAAVAVTRDHVHRLTVYSALLGVIITAYENTDRIGPRWVALAIALTTPLLIAWCVLSLTWIRLFTTRKLEWIADAQALPGWLALLAWAALGILAIFLRVIIVVAFSESVGSRLSVLCIARNGGLGLALLSPILIIAGKRWFQAER